MTNHSMRAKWSTANARLANKPFDDLFNDETLNKCPCGQIPDSLLIVDNGVKWAFATGNCCNEWHIEFRTRYNKIDSDECMKLAKEAWNNATRGE